MVSNYRGFSLLDVLSKILERQVYNEIFTIIFPHLTHWQHGFLPGNSTLSQLSQVVHQFANVLERRQQVDVAIFIQIFLRLLIVCLMKNSYLSLNALALVDPCYSVFRLYLTGRRHRVGIDKESSDFLPVTSGVLQGSILGPILSLLFINDMHNAISKETSLPLFTDDSKCFRLILGRDDGDKLQDDLNKLFQWSRICVMGFNSKKCKVLMVARIRSIDDRDYYLGGIQLDRVDVEKYLGFLVDLISSKAQRMFMSFTEHVGTLLILVQRNYFILLGFVRALNMLAWYDLIPNEISTIGNKFNVGLQDSFLEATILSMSALVS